MTRVSWILAVTAAWTGRAVAKGHPCRQGSRSGKRFSSINLIGELIGHGFFLGMKGFWQC